MEANLRGKYFQRKRLVLIKMESDEVKDNRIQICIRQEHGEYQTFENCPIQIRNTDRQFNSVTYSESFRPKTSYIKTKSQVDLPSFLFTIQLWLTMKQSIHTSPFPSTKLDSKTGYCDNTKLDQ